MIPFGCTFTCTYERRGEEGQHSYLDRSDPTTPADSPAFSYVEDGQVGDYHASSWSPSGAASCIVGRAAPDRQGAAPAQLVPVPGVPQLIGLLGHIRA
jgi:hypothetical protein